MANHGYDNPYRVLALSVVSSGNLATIKRVLTDDRYVKRVICSELRDADISGTFVDAIVTDLYQTRRRTEYVHKLDELAEYLYAALNLEELRKEIREFMDDCGISLDD